MQVEGEAEEFLAEAGWSPEYGVRELHRTVERLIQIPLSRLVLSGELNKYSHWHIACTREGISIVPMGNEKEKGKDLHETERL